MSSGYRWIITHDRIDDGRSVGREGPRDLDESLCFPDLLRPETIGDNPAEEFKMYDDDGIHYYTGLIVGNYDGMEPLDDYGMPNAGCTDIRYNGKSL